MKVIPEFVIGANFIEDNKEKNIAVPLFINKIIDKFGMYDEIRVQTTEKHNATANIVMTKLLDTGAFEKVGDPNLIKGFSNKCEKCGLKINYKVDNKNEVIHESVVCSNLECDCKNVKTFDVMEYHIRKIPAARRH